MTEFVDKMSDIVRVRGGPDDGSWHKVVLADEGLSLTIEIFFVAVLAAPFFHISLVQNILESFRILGVVIKQVPGRNTNATTPVLHDQILTCVA